MATYVPPVPSTKFSDAADRDFIIKEYLQKLKDKLDDLQTQINAITAALSGSSSS